MAHCQTTKLMDMDSGSLTESGGSTASSPPKSSAESLNSLKFGQKIYFKDVGMGVSAKSGADSFSSAATPPKKIRVGGVQCCQPPLCQVEGCKVDLSDAKAYYSRHKVCGMHSKSPKVIVAGIEQRFCQQCSRFHQLTEFDQGKRSCRRRLAGHNERRRKPPSGSFLSMRYGRLCASSSENSSRVGSFLMDFTASPKPTGRDGWSTSRSSERHFGNNAVGKYHPHPWQSTSQNSPSDLFLPSSFAGTHFSDPGIPPGEFIAPDSDSTRALSLLSNEPWGCRNLTSTLALSALEEAPMAQTTAHGGPHMSHLPATFEYYKGNTGPNGSPAMAPSLGPNHFSQPHSSSSFNATFSGNVMICQENKRQFMDVGQTGACESSAQHGHWLL